MSKETVLEQPTTQVDDNLARGYIRTSLIEPNSAQPSHQGAMTLIGAEIDTTVLLYNQLCSNFYMANYYLNRTGDNPVIEIQPGITTYGNQLAVYGELWKLNFKLQDLWREFYRWLNDETVVRVYNNEPVIINTPSLSGYVVLHPSIQTEIETGNDEYGAYFEVNLGGFGNSDAVIGGHYIHTRRAIRPRMIRY